MSLSPVNHYFNTEYYCNDVVGALNIPFGKSVVDKLFALQNSGTAGDEDINHPLTEENWK